jgi:hypothetical protein
VSVRQSENRVAETVRPLIHVPAVPRPTTPPPPPRLRLLLLLRLRLRLLRLLVPLRLSGALVGTTAQKDGEKRHSESDDESAYSETKRLVPEGPQTSDSRTCHVGSAADADAVAAATVPVGGSLARLPCGFAQRDSNNWSVQARERESSWRPKSQTPCISRTSRLGSRAAAAASSSVDVPAAYARPIAHSRARGTSRPVRVVTVDAAFRLR